MNNKNITKTRWTQNNDINVWNLSSIIRFQMVWVNQWNWYDSKIIKNYIVFFVLLLNLSACFSKETSWGVRIIKYSQSIFFLSNPFFKFISTIHPSSLPDFFGLQHGWITQKLEFAVWLLHVLNDWSLF